MREMKDSGIEWIGEMPKGWSITRFKYVNTGSNVGNSIDKQFWSYDENDLVFYTAGLNPIHATNDDFPSWKFTTGRDLLLARNGTPYVYMPLLHSEYSDHIIRVQIKEDFDRSFIRYCLQQSILSMIVDSVSIATWSISLWDEQFITLPPIEEQRRIAAYLDAKCSEIDALAADIQSQIDTLEQYKRSVITEAVTKGLDKNVEMKESGIPFIGTIPMDWKSDKLKYHLQRNEPRNPGDQEVLSLYRDYGIVLKDSRDDNFNVTSEDTSNYKYVQVGDFVINKMKAWQGSVAVSNYEGIVSPAYYVYKFTDDNIYRRYFHYLMRACYKDEFMRLSGGIRVGQWDLSATALENTYILIPPYEEQIRIADFLDDKKKDIDEAIAAKQEQLSTLDAYKKSTIYEYVTGKKEVPA